MAFNTVPSVSTSDSWTASQHNTYIKDNFAAVWVGTTAGDMDYYTSSTAKSRLAIGSSYQILRSTGSAPAWVSLSTVTGNAALVASQTAGDVFYATSATVAARLAIGASGTIMRSNGSIPVWYAAGTDNQFLRSLSSSTAWAGLVYSRQGGASNNWQTAGSTTYTPASTTIECGSKSVTLSGGSGNAAVTYPVAFTYRPHIYLSVNSSGGGYIPTYANDSTSGFTLYLYDVGAGSGTFTVTWMAIGE